MGMPVCCVGGVRVTVTPPGAHSPLFKYCHPEASFGHAVPSPELDLIPAWAMVKYDGAPPPSRPPMYQLSTPLSSHM